jgi:hypothetical protein
MSKSKEFWWGRRHYYNRAERTARGFREVGMIKRISRNENTREQFYEYVGIPEYTEINKQKCFA